jgi:L-threonylcarbamoyladenylate synthase
MQMRSVNISEAVQILTQGGLVAIPTETVYGLGGNGLDESVVLNIFSVKNRPAFDPLILHIPDVAHLQKYAKDIPAVVYTLAEAFWPGPLTILLPKKDLIPHLVTSGSPMAGFRVPDHPLTLELLQHLPFPLAAPSANPFGYISPTRAEHVEHQLGQKIEAILDGGPCSVGIESTVIQITDAEILILRKGAISETQLMEVSGFPVQFMSDEAHPTAPGMLKSHYAPAKPFYLQSPDSTVSKDRFAWIRFSDLHPDFPDNCQYVLSPEKDLNLAARRLFALMRQLDADPEIKEIYAEPVPEYGIGRAINDKLRKAAAGHYKNT